MKQKLIGTTFQERMDDLYRLAEPADRSLRLLIREMNEKFTGVAVTPGLKKRETAEQKCWRSEDGLPKQAPDDPDTLRDIVRATVQYSRVESLLAARDYIDNHPKVRVDTVKDRYFKDKAVASGYRDIKYFLFLDAGNSRELIGELQLNIQTALLGKELEHPVYEIIRRAGFGDTPAPVTLGIKDVAELGPKLRSVYIACKKASVLSATEQASLKKVVVSFFTGEDTTKPRLGSVTVTTEQIKILRSVTPKLFKHYEEQARNAKFMTSTGFQPGMSGKEFTRLT